MKIARTIAFRWLCRLLFFSIVSPTVNGNGAVTLGVELTQQTFEDQCPGNVLYESGLYLVEEVRIKRNPQVSIWSNTWLRETMQIVAPVPLRPLESDQDALLNQFIRSFQAG